MCVDITALDGAADFLGPCEDNRQVFTCSAGENVLGYVYAIVDESGEGYIDSFGVRDEVRGRGLGNCLLLTTLKWLSECKGVLEVGLTVAQDLINARSLYESVSFRVRHTGPSVPGRTGNLECHELGNASAFTECRSCPLGSFTRLLSIHGQLNIGILSGN
jgi:ribosomal protein S18 acetylase RimI-like enzyme